MAAWSQPEHGQDTCRMGETWAEEGEQSLCAGSSWSPFLLLTQCLLCLAFEVESNHAVPGSG